MAILLHTTRFRLDHRWTPRHLSDYMESDLTPAGRRRLEHHVAECDECRRLLAGLRRIVGTLHAVPAPATDADAAAVAASVRARLTDSG
jgi:anti-sigma factor RsiW